MEITHVDEGRAGLLAAKAAAKTLGARHDLVHGHAQHAMHHHLPLGGCLNDQ